MFKQVYNERNTLDFAQNEYAELVFGDDAFIEIKRIESI